VATETSSSEKISAKEKKWREAYRQFEKTADGLGLGIDAGIIDTVVVFNLLGINTRQSCEGHLDRGTRSPWIDLEAADVEGLEKQAASAFKIAGKRDRQKAPDEELDQLYSTAHELRRKIKEKHLAGAKKMMTYLDEFYKDRIVPYDRRLIVNISGYGNSRIESQGAAFQEVSQVEQRRLKLAEYQEEMREFTDFLKKKYFSE